MREKPILYQGDLERARCLLLPPVLECPTMITSKQTRCQRYCWGYITRFPGVSARDIATAQGDYTWTEVCEALRALEGAYIKRERENPYAWSPVVPFVVVGPGWAV